MLLDLALPDLDGFEVMRQLQERRQVPIVLLSAKGSTADKARGLDLGADDYLAKPFQDEELAARVRAILRRTFDVTGGPSVVGFDDVEIDLARRLVTRGGKLVHLSRTEWLLLSHLAANAGRVVLHGELLTKVWGPEYREDLGYLRVWVSRVRRKLGTPPGQAGRIRTFQGIGYLLDIRDPALRPRLISSRRGRAGPVRPGAAGSGPRSARLRPQPCPPDRRAFTPAVAPPLCPPGDADHRFRRPEPADCTPGVPNEDASRRSARHAPSRSVSAR